MQERLQGFDILRVVATFAVIAIHITSFYALILPAGYIANQMVRFAVPMFIILSGFLLYFADARKDYIAPLLFYRKRIMKIVRPYLIWTFLYTMLTIYCSGVWLAVKTLLFTLLYNLVMGNGFYHLYFLPIIFQLYFLYPFLRGIIRKQPGLLLAVSFIITMFSQTLLYLNKANIYGFYLSFPVWIFYFVLGMFVFLQEDRLRGLFQHWLAMGIIWAISLTLLIIDSKKTGTYASSIKPTIIFYTTASFFFFYSLALKVKQNCGEWLSWLSNQSFLIFLMHPMLLTVLRALPPHVGYPYLWAGVRGMILLYLATAILTIIGVYILSFSSLITWLGGQPRKTAAAA